MRIIHIPNSDCLRKDNLKGDSSNMRILSRSSSCLVVIVITWICGATNAVEIAAEYPRGTADSVTWNNIAIDPETNTVYAGGVNRLFRLDKDLSVIDTERTGPVLDDPQCYNNFSQNPCLNADSVPQPTRSTDNINKVLVVDSKHRQLVTCGSVFQGTCETRSLSNVSSATNYPSRFSQYVIVVSRTYPTVAFAGPGPFGDDVLYVGTNYEGTSSTEWLLAKFLAGVSSRNMTQPGAFLVTEVDDRNAYGTRAYVTSDAASKYRVTYVAGFSLNGFSYFLTTQPESFTAQVIPKVLTSKIVQVCQFDQYFDSYVEMQITCSSAGVDYNIIQAGVFVRPGATLAGALGLTVNDYVLLGVFSTSNQSGFGSALCVYPLSEIRRRFTANIQRCYNSVSDLVGPQFYGFNRRCSASQVTINDSYCGNMFQFLSRLSIPRNSPLVGSIPLNGSTPSLILSAVNVTAINAVTVDDHTVAFLGTADGKLLKVVVDSNNGTVYENSGVGRSPVNQDLLLSPDGSHLYLMTSEKIFKIPVSSCQQFTNCDQCLSAKDPYCGWCTLENSCRMRSECPNNQLSNRWLSFYSLANRICPRVNVQPISADINADVNVSVEITSLPELRTDEFYSCLFGSSGSGSRATLVGNQIICPMMREKPTLPSSDDNIVISLSIQMSEASTYFVLANFTFYDCSHHTACSSCASTPWSCSWCIFANKCQNRTSSCTYSSSVQQNQFCPSLLPESKEILIPVGIEQTISLTANNLPVPQASEKGYSCEISSVKQTKLLPARRLSSNLINCSSYLFPSAEDATLRVLWGDGNFAIEGSYNLTVFNCSALADGNCNRCLSLQYQPFDKFGCQWCGGVCQPNVSVCDSQMNEEIKCPRAVITSIFPQSGPKEGGTLVTVTGTNLGYRFDRVAVLVGSDSCRGVSEKYIVAQQYVCVTNSVSTIGRRNLTVMVSNEPAYQEPKFNNFVFKNPVGTYLRPDTGVEAGGTQVTLFGQDLDVGSNAAAYMNENPCLIDRARSNETQLVFTTPGCNFSCLMTDFKLRIDNAVWSLMGAFHYTANPVLTMPTPSGSFQTGGCMVTVSTSNLDSVVDIRLNLTNGHYAFPGNVTSRNSSAFQFRSPNVSGIVDYNIGYELQVKMDGVSDKFPFTVFPDPFVQPFANGVRSYGGDTLQLNGRNMLVPCMNNYESEVFVYVGTQMCNISSLTETNLYCKPPNKAPDGATRARVTVTVGSNLRFDLGDLVYQAEPTSIFWPIIVGVIGGVLIIIIILLIFIFCLMSSKNERQYGKLQAQMEALESGVRNECKQAFTELQTDVSDFTSDISTIGIPFWEYRMYSFRLLFPMVMSHQVLYINTHNGKQLGEFGEKMHRFNQLLSSKYFLLTFIHTMEKQPQDFGITDRSKVASLLSVVLMDKMEYATEIIKILLDELIVRSIEKRAPKLMLRRAETVVEKLLANWLSLSMYGYVKTHAGRALFMLYKAIKHQTEKGPIDAVTAEAKYSLSEDRLLREKIEAKTLGVTVYDTENSGQPPVMCKMLDCDTITQAKEKALDAIYKNCPFSKRPSRNIVDLRWSAGRQLDGYPSEPRDFLPLNDQDVTTELVDGWKRVNTLSHYHIKEGSAFQLQKNKRNEPVHLVHGMIELETGTLLSTIRLDEGAKVWHLVKHDDPSNNVSRTQKVISEIFLTRLLQTKMTLQQYIDDLFTTILKVDSSLPPTVKYLYDFLDSAAQRHNITDSEVIHAWKSNSLPLRFWVNLIKNPEFLFDINKSPVVDCCLSVIAQTFMDSCSTHEHRLGKDSPSAKLLFAKDIPRYRQLVSQFYIGIRDLPPISEDAMARMMADLSVTYSAEVNQEIALHELYDYALRFSTELLMALENDPSAKKLRLAEHFEQLHLMKDENPNNSTI